MEASGSNPQPQESNNAFPLMTGINLISIPLWRPWFSIGTLNEIREPFFPDIHTPGIETNIDGIINLQDNSGPPPDILG